MNRKTQNANLVLLTCEVLLSPFKFVLLFKETIGNFVFGCVILFFTFGFFIRLFSLTTFGELGIPKLG